jgi:hypothetical protein
MDSTLVKIYASALTVSAINLSNIELSLKIVLALLVIGYTGQKWYLQNRDKNKK